MKTGNVDLKGNNLNDIQDMNRSLVLRLLKKNNICSRAELAKQSGLKQATITNIINDFLEWGIVKETGLMSGEKGRRCIGVQINHKEYYVIGVRLTRNFFNVGLFDIFGQRISNKRIDNNKLSGPASVVSRMKDEIAGLLGQNKDKNIIGIGIAVPGPYFRNEGRISSVTDFPGWDDIHFKQEITEAFDIPVIIDHDANAGALAEWWIAPNEMVKGTMVYIAVGQGIGAGVIHDGKLFRGALGTAGEIGHTSINFNGPLCECGNRGCLTHYVSTTDFMRRVEEAMPKYPDTALKQGFAFKDLVAAVKQGDALAVDIFGEIMQYLSAGIINVICTYGPNEIVVGDEMSEIGQLLIDMLYQLQNGHTFQSFNRQVRIRLSSFDMDPAFVGAAALAIDYCLGNTSIFESNALRNAD